MYSWLVIQFVPILYTTYEHEHFLIELVFKFYFLKWVPENKGQDIV